jgi:hypothetical protein
MEAPPVPVLALPLVPAAPTPPLPTWELPAAELPPLAPFDVPPAPASPPDWAPPAHATSMPKTRNQADEGIRDWVVM